MPSAGLYVGARFGEKVWFEWGGELGLVADTGRSCSAPRRGIGPFLRVDVAGLRPRFTLGALAGLARQHLAYGGQLGISIRDPKGGVPVDLYTALRFDFDHAAFQAHQNWFPFEHAYTAGFTTGPFIDEWCPHGGVSHTP